MANTHKDFHCRYCGTGMGIIMSSDPRVDDMKPFRDHEARCKRRLTREAQAVAALDKVIDGMPAVLPFTFSRPRRAQSRYSRQAWTRAQFVGAAPSAAPRESTMNAEIAREEWLAADDAADDSDDSADADAKFVCSCGAWFYAADHLARHRESLCWDVARLAACRAAARYRIAGEYYDRETEKALGKAAIRAWSRANALYERGFKA